MELTESQTQELARLKAYFPYRIIYGMIDKTTGQFTASAVQNMRIPNKLTRDGHTVFILKGG
jgi:hypothetical protein